MTQASMGDFTDEVESFLEEVRNEEVTKTVTCDDRKMTVVFEMHDKTGQITVRTSANHYARAVGYASEEAYDCDEEDYADAPEEMDLDRQLWLDNQVKRIRVYEGWPADGSDDVEEMELIHEE